jgi:hypothetical protein
VSIFKSSDIPIWIAEELNGGRQKGNIGECCSNYVQVGWINNPEILIQIRFVLLSDCLMLFDGRVSKWLLQFTGNQNLIAVDGTSGLSSDKEMNSLNDLLRRVHTKGKHQNTYAMRQSRITNAQSERRDQSLSLRTWVLKSSPDSRGTVIVQLSKPVPPAPIPEWPVSIGTADCDGICAPTQLCMNHLARRLGICI